MGDDIDRIDRRLSDWFAGEVRRAERDLAVGALAPGRHRPRRRLPAAALAVAVVVVAIVGVVARPTPDPRPGSEPTRPASTGVLADRDVVLGADGLPVEIDGETVVRVPDLGLVLRSAQSEAIVAGWHARIVTRCAVRPPDRPSHLLLPWCNPHRLLAEPEDLGPPLQLAVVGAAVPEGWVALRVHWNDPGAVECPEEYRRQCQSAVVVDEVTWSASALERAIARFADGIPSELGGQPIHRPTDLPAVRGTESFLLGGWHAAETWFGCGRLGESHPLLDHCWPERLNDTPGLGGPILMAARDVPDGPVIVRVHTNDPRSATCPEQERAACAAAIVVDEVLWAGDETTLREPLSIDGVVRRLRPVLEAAGAGNVGVEVDDFDRPSCDPGYPRPVWRVTGSERVGNILVFPSVASRAAVDQNFGMSGWTGRGGCTVQTDSQYAWLWVSVENIIVQVYLTHPAGTDAERAFAQEVRAALERP